MKIRFVRPDGDQREYRVRAVAGEHILNKESVYDVEAEIAQVLIAQGDFAAVVDVPAPPVEDAPAPKPAGGKK